MTFNLLFLFFQLFSVSSETEVQSGLIATFIVEPGNSKRLNTPVFIDISGITTDRQSGDLQLFEITPDGPKKVNSQIESKQNLNFLWWILEGETPPGALRKFELRRSDSSKEANSDIKSVDNGEAIHFQIAEKKVLAYQYRITQVPDGVSEIYQRGGYIHPLWSPAGAIITRIQPPDHYHHYGIWNPWTHTEFEGREIDFWNLYKGQGTVVVKGDPTVIDGKIFSDLFTFHQHIVKADSLNPADKTALNESIQIRIWNADPQQKVWLVDIISTLTCAVELPFTIKEYRYQGFSLRANKNWDDQTATLITSEGKDKSNANGTRARWCDVKGPSIAGTSGIVFMTHPDNFNYPELLRIWPTGMNEGKENVFVNFNPAQDRDWILEPGKSYTLRYRLLMYDGSIDRQLAENYWNDFTNPPLVIMQD